MKVAVVGATGPGRFQNVTGIGGKKFSGDGIDSRCLGKIGGQRS